MLAPVCLESFKSVDAQLCGVAVLVLAFVSAFPDQGKLIFVAVGCGSDDGFTTGAERGANGSPELCGYAGPHEGELVSVEQGNTHTPSSVLCGGLRYDPGSVVEVYAAFVVAHSSGADMVGAVFVGESYALHDLLRAEVFVCRDQDSAVGHEHGIPQEIACGAGALAGLSRHEADAESIVVIVIDQAFLIIPGMIQHLAPDGMLDVEEIVHEVEIAISGIHAAFQLIHLLGGIKLPDIRRLDYLYFFLCHDYLIP